MAYSFIINDEALKELIEEFLWYEEQQPGLGKEFRTEVYIKLNKVCNNPFHYKIPNKKFHEALVERFPFLIVYFVDEENKVIIVTAIFHTSRNPKNKFKRKRLK
jgi:plasmid stabilization system protein ParE